MLIDGRYLEDPFMDSTYDTYLTITLPQDIGLNQVFQGRFMDSSFYFDGKKGEAIEVYISPLPWDKNTDVSFDIFQENMSILTPKIWKFSNYLYIIYILLFVPILFLLFRGLMKKSKTELN